jgi:hypothetical protein
MSGMRPVGVVTHGVWNRDSGCSLRCPSLPEGECMSRNRAHDSRHSLFPSLGWLACLLRPKRRERACGNGTKVHDQQMHIALSVIPVRTSSRPHIAAASCQLCTLPDPGCQGARTERPLPQARRLARFVLPTVAFPSHGPNTRHRSVLADRVSPASTVAHGPPLHCCAH